MKTAQKRFVYTLHNMAGNGLVCVTVDDLNWLAEITNGERVGSQVLSDKRLDLSDAIIARHLAACALRCNMIDVVESMAHFWLSTAQLYPTSTIDEISQMMGQQVPV